MMQTKGTTSKRMNTNHDNNNHNSNSNNNNNNSTDNSNTVSKENTEYKNESGNVGDLFEDKIEQALFTSDNVEKRPKKNGVSFMTLAVVLAFTIIITFMITCLTVSNYKDKVFEASVEAMVEKIEKVNSMVLGVEITDEERLMLYQYLLELDIMFKNYEFNEYDYEKLTDYLLSAYAAAVGDDYAVYYNAEEMEEMLASMLGENQGIGINIAYDSDESAIYVINVMIGSPADNAGILPGDLIVAVGTGSNKEYISDIGYSSALSKLQGKKGTTAEFTVKRGSEMLEFSILRDEYENQSVVSHIYELDNTVGVIRILNFDALTPEQFSNAMEELYSKGIRKVVFDVRNNPGGNLNSIVQVLDSILTEGPIIRIVNKNGITVQQINSDSDAKYTDVKFAVLANGNTASAAELFTAALKDYGRAVIVGTKTFGKGSMQSTLSLSGNRGVKLTTYHYLPPYSEGYDGIGITPDVTVEMSEEFADKNIFIIGDKDDNQLKTAVESIK